MTCRKLRRGDRPARRRSAVRQGDQPRTRLPQLGLLHVGRDRELQVRRRLVADRRAAFPRHVPARRARREHRGTVRADSPGTGDLLTDPCAPEPIGDHGHARALCSGRSEQSTPATLPSRPPARSTTSPAATTPDAGRSRHNTFGVVWQPDFVPGLSMTVDYYDIKVDNAIALRPAFDSSTAATTARNPTSGGDEPGLPAHPPRHHQRYAQGALRLRRRAAQRTTSAKFTPKASTTRSATPGTSEPGAGSTPLSTAHMCWTRATSPLRPAERRVRGRYGKQCGFPSTATGSTAARRRRTTSSDDDLDLRPVRGRIRLAPPVRIEGRCCAGGSHRPQSASIPAYNYLDLFGSWQVTDWAKLKFGVTNVTDEEAPFVQTETGSTPFNSGNTYPSTYDVLGRVFTVGVTTKF